MYFIEDYKEFRNEAQHGRALWVDKSIFIEKALNDRAKASVIVQPRKWGKSVNLSMLFHFFDQETDTRDLFSGTYIENSFASKSRDSYVALMFSFPKSQSMTMFEHAIKENIAYLYQSCAYLSDDGSALPESMKEKIRSRMSGVFSEGELETSLYYLAEVLAKYHEKKAIILIDDYDVVVSTSSGQEEKVDRLIRSMLTKPAWLRYVERSMIAGSSIKKDRLPEGVRLYTASDRYYEDCFGFSEEEVDKYVEAGAASRLRARYGGYRLGSRDLYHPISLLSLDEDTDISVPSFSEPLGAISERMLACLIELLDNKTVSTVLSESEHEFLSLCVAEGCLSMVKEKDRGAYAISIPNGLALEFWRGKIERMSHALVEYAGISIGPIFETGSFETMEFILKKYTAHIQASKGRLAKRAEYLSAIFVLGVHASCAVFLEGVRLVIHSDQAKISYLFEIYEDVEQVQVEYAEYKLQALLRSMRESREQEGRTAGREYHVALVVTSEGVRLAAIYHDYAYEASLRNKRERSVIFTHDPDYAKRQYKGIDLANYDPPLGEDNYKIIVQRANIFVDKTLFIRDFFDDPSEAMLIARPRRFGKSLNMSMLHHFCTPELAEYNRQSFYGTKVERALLKTQVPVMTYQGQYPTILITFKNVRAGSYKESVRLIQETMSSTYRRYHRLGIFKSSLEQEFIRKMVSEHHVAEEEETQRSLSKLIEYLGEYYKKQVIVLLDEYDTPLHTLFLDGPKYGVGNPMGSGDELKQLLRFFEKLIGSAFKGNSYLKKGVLVGTTRSSLSTLFSGLNNLSVRTVLDPEYAEFFGLTEEEVSEYLEVYSRLNRRETMPRMEEMREWYNGYQMGSVKLYNPWSVLNYLATGVPREYWNASGSEQLVERYLWNGIAKIRESLERLLQREAVSVHVERSLDLERHVGDPEMLWTVLVSAGYLKIVAQGEKAHEWVVSIPNKEIFHVYEKIVCSWSGVLSFSDIDYRSALLRADLEQFRRLLADWLIHVVSYHDLNDSTKENVYHVFCLGVFFNLNSMYQVHSNKESGRGRSDIILVPRVKGPPAYIFEFKASKSSEDCESSAKLALKQINVKEYEAMLEPEDRRNVYKVGMSFCGKDVGMCWSHASAVSLGKRSVPEEKEYEEEHGRAQRQCK